MNYTSSPSRHNHRRTATRHFGVSCCCLVSFRIGTNKFGSRWGHLRGKDGPQHHCQGESPTKKPRTKEHHKKSTEQSPSKDQTARTLFTPRKAVKVPKTREPTTSTALKTPTTPSAKLLRPIKATTTVVRNHATASNTSLHRLLERLMDLVTEKQP